MHDDIRQLRARHLIRRTIGHDRAVDIQLTKSKSKMQASDAGADDADALPAEVCDIHGTLLGFRREAWWSAG
jgi:hypothetical protein